MNGYALQIRELFDRLREQKELAGIPPVTDALMRQLANDGARIIHEEARRTKRRFGPE